MMSLGCGCSETFLMPPCLLLGGFHLAAHGSCSLTSPQQSFPFVPAKTTAATLLWPLSGVCTSGLAATCGAGS